jgi:hypothetical protein
MFKQNKLLSVCLILLKNNSMGSTKNTSLLNFSKSKNNNHINIHKYIKGPIVKQQIDATCTTAIDILKNGPANIPNIIA